MSGTFWRVSRWFLFSFFFAFLPLVLINWSLEQSWTRQIQRSSEVEGDKLLRLLEKVRKTGDEELYFRHWLDHISEECSKRVKSEKRLKSLSGYILSLKKLYPGLFDFYITNATGDLISSISAPVPGKAIIKSLYQKLNECKSKGTSLPLEQKRKIFEIFLGESCLFADLIAPISKKPLPRVGVSGRHTFFYHKAFSNIGVMAHLNRSAVSTNFPLETIIRRLNRKLKTHYLGTHSAGAVFPKTKHPKEISEFVEFALNRFETSTQEIFFQKNDIVSVLMADSKLRIWGFMQGSRNSDFEIRRQNTYLMTFAIILIFAGTSFNFLVPERRKWLSIRVKLIGLLGFATVLPLVVLFVTGKDYLQEKEQILLNQAIQEMTSILKGLDNKFPQIFQSMENHLNRLMRHSCDSAGNFIEKKYDAEFKNLAGKIPVHNPMIIFRDGTLIRTQTKDNLFYHLGLRIMLKYNRSLGFPDDEKVAAKLRAGSLFGDDKQISEAISGFLRNTGKISRMTFGKMDKFSFINMITGKGGIANYFFFFTWKLRELHSLYLKRTLLSRQRDLSDSRLFAVKPSDTEHNFPKGVERIGWLSSFVSRVEARRSFTSDQINIKGKKFLIAGIPGRELEAYFLLQVFPLDKLTLEIEGLRSRLLSLAFLCLILSIAVGAVLAGQFLKPVQNLSSGVSAIQTGKFSYRIPITENDELGTLSGTFNRMMEGLQELSVAKTVQESLFPSGVIASGAWKVFGQTKAASELGGDYFDYFVLPDRRLVAAIGDVSGHGVPAALLMAMAKATIKNEADTDPSPARIMSILNKLIFGTMNRRRLMTFFYAIVEPATGIMKFANAGHCRPIFQKADGSQVELGKASMPLGARKSQVYIEETIALSLGERVIFYTDGFPEAKNFQGNPLDYEGLKSVCKKASSSDIVVDCQQIFSITADYRGNSPQDDDLTIIILDHTDLEIATETQSPQSY